ncbi:MAG: BlaI/MecI/CopY family transcriptional regulator [Chlorobi bacterium]|nr:BlaI/MecI/CopY family transcriptional regulator [Chlorobiota bacterium]
MKELTKAEDQVMQILWQIEKGFVKDIVEKFSEPRPAYNTVSTIIRILEKKGFVGHKSYGKTFEYFPVVTKDEYKKTFMKGFIKKYFSNSYKNMVSFLAKEENLSVSEMEEIMELIKSKRK